MGELDQEHGNASESSRARADDVLSSEERTRAAREGLIGKSIAGRYVLRALVGHGGMGAVYEAEHLGLGKRVAIKFIDQEFATDERVVARFAREARAMSAIESAHIVTVFDAGVEEGRPYLVMELLRGEDLGQRLRRSRRVPLGEAMHVVAQVLKGLAKAHAAGIVHRDLKPDNVFLIKSDTDPLFAKIVDFGVSKIERPRDKTSPLALTGRGTILGTPFYMCPEQAQAMPDVDVRADIYSVGAILFECLTGRPPHTGETYEQVILSICMRDAPDVRAIDPSLSPSIAAFVARALARDRTERFGSAERMLAALHELAPEEKARVPLDAGAPDTLLSPGVLFPAPNKSAPGSSRTPSLGATRIAGSGEVGLRAPSDTPATPPPRASVLRTSDAAAPAPRRASSPGASPSIGAKMEAALFAAGPPSRRKRSVTTVVLTAALAMLTGVGVMLGAIVMLDKKSGATATPSVSTFPVSAAHPTPPTITSGVTSASATSGGSVGAASPASTSPAPSASASPAISPAVSSAATSASAPATSTKPATRPPGSAAPKGTAKPLDISRDLP